MLIFLPYLIQCRTFAQKMSASILLQAFSLPLKPIFNCHLCARYADKMIIRVWILEYKRKKIEKASIQNEGQMPCDLILKITDCGYKSFINYLVVSAVEESKQLLDEYAALMIANIS
jgi:hypothetical protein